MLYPFSLTLDLYIQAESFEEAKKLAEAYVQDASLDTTDYPEIVQDVLEVADGVTVAPGRPVPARSGGGRHRSPVEHKPV